LFEAEKRIDVSGLSQYSKRAVSFLAEKLMNVFVVHNNLIPYYSPLYLVEPGNFKWWFINNLAAMKNSISSFLHYDERKLGHPS
jgi:hypothetical protein